MNIIVKAALRGIAGTMDAVSDQIERIQLQSPVKVKEPLAKKAEEHLRVLRRIESLRKQQAEMCRQAQQLEKRADALRIELEEGGLQLQAVMNENSLLV